jgi:hypothetical protein
VAQDVIFGNVIAVERLNHARAVAKMLKSPMLGRPRTSRTTSKHFMYVKVRKHEARA